jgi:hypothetical protein
VNVSVSLRSKLGNKANSREELRVPSDRFLDAGHADEEYAEAALIENWSTIAPNCSWPDDPLH